MPNLPRRDIFANAKVIFAVGIVVFYSHKAAAGNITMRSIIPLPLAISLAIGEYN